MDKTKLLELIEQRESTDPVFAELVQERVDYKIAELLSENLYEPDTTTKWSSLGIAEKHAPLNGIPGPLAAESTLLKLEGFSQYAIQSEDPLLMLLGNAIIRQMKHLSGEGMVIGSASLRDIFQILVNAGAITQQEMDTFLDIGNVKVNVSVSDVSSVLNSRGL